MPLSQRSCRALALGGMWLALTAGPSAQSEQHDHAAMVAEQPRWNFSWDARVFTAWNYQYRKFRDFQRVESENWFMGEAERGGTAGHMRLTGMFSLEPFTMQALGSPEVFQTGETYQQAPL